MIYVFIIFNKFPVLLEWNLKFLYTKINRRFYWYQLNDFLKYTRYEFATKTRSYRRELLAESWVDDATLLVHSPSSEKQKQPLGDSIFRIYQTVNWGSFAIITKRWSKYLLRTMHSSILDWLALSFHSRFSLQFSNRHSHNFCPKGRCSRNPHFTIVFRISRDYCFTGVIKGLKNAKYTKHTELATLRLLGVYAVSLIPVGSV